MSSLPPHPFSTPVGPIAMPADNYGVIYYLQLGVGSVAEWMSGLKQTTLSLNQNPLYQNKQQHVHIKGIFEDKNEPLLRYK